MVSPGFFYKALRRRGVVFITGVPDSLLKDFCAYVGVNSSPSSYMVAVNEGAAIALGAGFHFATGGIPLIFMQNSGLGNAVNPLLSLCDANVYSIPALLLVGWRGEPGLHDEPQHITQGRLTLPLLQTLNIPHLVMEDSESAVSVQIDAAFRELKTQNAPFALVVRKGTFTPYRLDGRDVGGNSEFHAKLSLSREEAIEEIILSSPDDLFFSTTGMASRELYELREKHCMGGGRDFLTVGSMGHASSIALGAALARPGAPITCIDGDGSALMHLGALAAIGAAKPRRLRHILLNNGAHDSVGGQPTIAFDVDLAAIARASGYRRVFYADTRQDLRLALRAGDADGREGPVFIEVRVKTGARPDLGRPKSSPVENKTAFMRHFREIGAEEAFQ
ncbi:MAG: phosphonopyruvate decarboxylase [Spirochaetaceae bacterium]|jgi:phosphonopyruvate decarboxylase|nr:phosphonopyruvate decarboxylase [Spirochaetaceae bacterium]